jgi:hypothetical protein
MMFSNRIKRMLAALIAMLGCASLAPLFAGQPDSKPERSDRDIAYEQIKQTLPKDSQRAKSARLELDCWYRHPTSVRGAIWKSAQTKDGKTAEVLLLDTPSPSMPGTDFSMAFLLVDKRVVDWASCWSNNRIAQQQLLLEDVDGDGILDLAFRASEGWFGLFDKRQHRRPGDKRAWLYAYTITSKGFRSIFPDIDRDRRLKLAYDTGGLPVKLRIDGLPKVLKQYQMYQCTVFATNTSEQEVRIASWPFYFEIDDDGFPLIPDRQELRMSSSQGKPLPRPLASWRRATSQKSRFGWSSGGKIDAKNGYLLAPQ